MTMERKLLGRKGEDAAALYLEKNGYRLLHRNYSCRLGEIDLVAMDREVLVFVEVRARSGDGFGLGQESVTKSKQIKLRQLAWYYLKAEGKTDSYCRFDVIAILFDVTGTIVRLEHIENAF